jgi:hypothetical protein
LGPGYYANNIVSATFRIWYVPEYCFLQGCGDSFAWDTSSVYGIVLGNEHNLTGPGSYDWGYYNWTPTESNWDTLSSSGTNVHYTDVTIYSSSYSSSWWLLSALADNAFSIPSGNMVGYATATATDPGPGDAGSASGTNYSCLTYQIFDIRPIAYNAPTTHATVQLSDGTDPTSYGGATVTIQDSMGAYYCNQVVNDNFVAAAVLSDAMGDGPAPTGSYLVTISVPGYNSYSTWATLTQGAAYTDLGTVTLTPAP